jgi:hypothetical protein
MVCKGVTIITVISAISYRALRYPTAWGPVNLKSAAFVTFKKTLFWEFATHG